MNLLEVASNINWNDFVGTLLMEIQFVVAVLMFTKNTARRSGFYGRLTIVALLILGIAVSAGLVPTNLNFEVYYQSQLINAFLIPLVLLAFIGFVFKVSLWGALFYCIGVFVLQNLTSGCEGFARVFLATNGISIGSMTYTLVSTFVITFIVYFVAYALLINKIDSEHLAPGEDKRMLLVMIVVVLVAVVFDMINKTLTRFEVPISYVLALRTVHGSVCIFILYAEYEMLYNRRLMADTATLENLISASERQYKMSRENIEAINIKCHDLKHQIRELREGGAAVSDEALNEIEHAVGIYDAVIKTGNDALDTIITEKSLVCEREHIALSCIIDGSTLNNIAPSDLYSLFGNIMDNAIEATRKIEERDRRTIGLTVRQNLGMTVIHSENFYYGDIEMRDGLPVTSKLRADGTADTTNHGFGMQSMRLLAQRYGGSMTCKAQDGIFTLDLLLPAA